jgi:predicted nucleic acid-binding protein
MGEWSVTTSEVFVDTAFVVALASRQDQYHAAATAMVPRFDSGTRLVTTWAVCLEIGNALARQQHRQKGVELLRGIARDPRFEIMPLTEDLYLSGMTLFFERRDKEWSLTDCLSFVVMERRGIRLALTADEHFRQAGFEPLLA